MSLPAPSLWLRELGRDRWRPQLDGSLEADVAIVGGGLSGLWTAHAVLDARPGASVVVLEAERVGWGASGRNGGWASALFPVSWGTVARSFGPEGARALRVRLVENLDEIEAALGDDAADVEWHRAGTLVAARSEEQWRALVADVQEEQALGLRDPGVLLDARGVRARLAIDGAVGGVFEPVCASVHPAKLVELLARRLEQRGGLVLERSRVHSGAPGVLVGVGGRVRASQVVWATESYSAAEPRWHRALAPVASQIIATAPLSAAQRERLGNPEAGLTFSDGRRLVIYGQLRADGRVIFGGRGAPYRFGSGVEFATEVGARMRLGLAATLADLLREAGPVEIEASWGGTIGVSRDWYPRVLHDPNERIVFVGGYAGDGVAMTRLAGQLAAAYATGVRLDPDLAVILGRPLRRWEPEPMRWLGVNVGLGLTRLGDALEGRPLAQRAVDVLRGAVLGR